MQHGLHHFDSRVCHIIIAMYFDCHCVIVIYVPVRYILSMSDIKQLCTAFLQQIMYLFLISRQEYIKYTYI